MVYRKRGDVTVYLEIQPYTRSVASSRCQGSFLSDLQTSFLEFADRSLYEISQRRKAICASSMEDVNDFDSVFGTKPDLAYNHQTIEQIHRCRRALENELFFDRLLKAVGVDQGT